jgi:L-Ala-D/L-Glu epimerase
MMRVSVRRVDWDFKSVFRIAYRSRTQVATIVIELHDGEVTGRGEASGVSYRGETVDTLQEQISAVTDDLCNGLSRTDLQRRLPAGGARSAIDCALWDLEAKRAGRRAWELAAVPIAGPLVTAFTLSLDTPEAMGKAAAAASQFPMLKIKLTGEGDLERLASIREARPTARLIVDANQGWSERRLCDFIPRFAEFGVELIEQPLPVGEDAVLARFESPIPLCADESCQTADSLATLIGKYQFINIKLDKTGGLTEALRLAELARQRGMRLMVGCMAGSSLAMAPAMIIGQLCEFVDLDGPLHLKSDVPHAIRYESGRMLAPSARLWG